MGGWMSKREKTNQSVRTRQKPFIDFICFTLISLDGAHKPEPQMPATLVFHFKCQPPCPKQGRKKRQSAFDSRMELYLFKSSWLLTQATAHTGFAMKFWTFSPNSLFYPIFISARQAFIDIKMEKIQVTLTRFGFPRSLRAMQMIFGHHLFLPSPHSGQFQQIGENQNHKNKFFTAKLNENSLLPRALLYRCRRGQNCSSSLLNNGSLEEQDEEKFIISAMFSLNLGSRLKRKLLPDLITISKFYSSTGHTNRIKATQISLCFYSCCVFTWVLVGVILGYFLMNTEELNQLQSKFSGFFVSKSDKKDDFIAN
ncbi:uncharacterized protein LOC113912705 [Zalophus californianus]|uniref:Uncharacterized protein LOC113912705 n=1 Tax=Zalophus californianus TaxID=9704 RepID=A0A6J2BPN0_ZALCA|nr:uncharacterized protein LOC113912705 [Zalophus californianus]